MRKFILIVAAVAALASLTMTSCEKLNDTAERVNVIEGEVIPTLAQQIVSVDSTTVELAKIQAFLAKEVASLTKVDTEFVKVLLEACRVLDTRITELRIYTDTLNENTRTWAEGTFSTLEQYAETMAALDSVYAEFNNVYNELDLVYDTIDSTRTEFNVLIGKAVEGVQAWVSESFKDYYTAVQINSIVLGLKEDYTSEVAVLRGEVSTALDSVKSAYTHAIKVAIEEQAGVFDRKLKNEIASVNAYVNSVANKVYNLETTVWNILNLVETITYLPKYDDGAIHVAFDGVVGAYKADTIAVDYRFSKLPAYDIKPWMFCVRTHKVEYATKGDRYPSQIKVDSVKVSASNYGDNKNGENIVRLYLNPVDVNKALNTLSGTHFTTAISTDFFQWTKVNIGKDTKTSCHVVSSAYTPVYFHRDN